MKRNLRFPKAPCHKLINGPVATSWGSKGEAVAPHDGKVTAFLVTKGTPAMLHHIATGRTQPFKTTHDCLFSMRQCKRDGYHFRHAGYELVVSKWKVRTASARREDLLD